MEMELTFKVDGRGEETGEAMKDAVEALKNACSRWLYNYEAEGAAADPTYLTDVRVIEPTSPVNPLVDAARCITYQRDYKALHGHYDASQPNPDAEPDQQFDDWAADILGTALAGHETPQEVFAVLVDGNFQTVRGDIDNAIEVRDNFNDSFIRLGKPERAVLVAGVLQYDPANVLSNV